MENRLKDAVLLRQALSRNEFSLIREYSHRIKGVGGLYGFHGITEYGEAIWEAAEEENTEELRTLIEGLSLYLEKVKIVYE